MEKAFKDNKYRITQKTDYWYDVIIGGIITFMIIYPVGSLIFKKLNLEFLNIYYLIFCIGIITYYQWKDDNLKLIKTNLTTKENFELVKNTLDKLNWEYETNSTEIKLTYNKYLLKFLNVTIIPKSEYIYFNFKYHSLARTGRLPFFFGINTIISLKFKKGIINQLNKKPNG